MRLQALMVTLSVFHSSTLVYGQQWITRFHPIESQFELIASSPLLPQESSSLSIESAKGKGEMYYTSTTLPPVTTSVTPTARRVPLKSTLISNVPRKIYHGRQATLNNKKVYEYGNQHQPSTPGQVYRKKFVYYKPSSSYNNGPRYEYFNQAASTKQTPMPQATFIAYPILYQRSKNGQRKSPILAKDKETYQVSRVSPNPPEQIAPVNPPTVTVTAPKFIRRKANGRSASLLDLESSRLNPDQSLGNDMLYYPEPSSDDDTSSSSSDKNGISNDPNSEFVIIK